MTIPPSPRIIISRACVAHDASSPSDVQYVKMFDGECENGKELRMYEGTGDNPGKTVEQKVAACSMACLTKKAPVDEKSWTNFVSKGFIVKPNGRCYCESADSITCSQDFENNADSFDRYDWRSLGL